MQFIDIRIIRLTMMLLLVLDIVVQKAYMDKMVEIVLESIFSRKYV